MKKERALLLMNMGGPNNLDEVELFLKNMFNDRRIISAPQPIRSLIARLITWRRADEARSNYAALGGKSPIVAYTQKLVEKLGETIDASVHMVMRYTPPFAADHIARLREVDEIYAIPLYPHHSSTTTLSSFDDLHDTLRRHGIKAELRYVEHYYADPAYITSIVSRIREALDGDDPAGYELVFSAHGLPQKIIDRGDLYQRHIRYTLFHARKALLLEGIRFHRTHLAYQSRLGPLEWIRPYLDDKLRTLRKKKVIIFPIAFTIDNSETEYELAMEYRELAETLAFEEYRVARAPNDHPDFVACLRGLYGKML